MTWTKMSTWLSGLALSFIALGAQAEDEPTMIILPDEAADQADAVTQNITLPEKSSENDAEEVAANGLDIAQARAAEAAEEGLATAVDAAARTREQLGRANMPEGLPNGPPVDPENLTPQGGNVPDPGQTG